MSLNSNTMTLGPANNPSGAQHGKAQQLTSSNKPIGILCWLPAGQQLGLLQNTPPCLALYSCTGVGSLRADSFKNTFIEEPTTSIALPFRNSAEAASGTHYFCAEGAFCANGLGDKQTFLRPLPCDLRYRAANAISYIRAACTPMASLTEAVALPS